MMDLQRMQQNINTVFGVFAHHRRRYALRGLRMHETAMTLAELAEEVAIRENEAPVTDISPEVLECVHVSLYHTHIPKLADEGFVRYDRKEGIIALSERAQQVEQYQELLTVE
ncbi:hypothetical protein OB955_08495 [Halobacteria archaeon AArc-m2/3/4]|nr:hypothetical protein [Halobacteria archaeon AArc-m2/3/4]